MNEVKDFIRKCGVFYLATIDGNVPRVRPFGKNLKDIYIF